jgi:Ran GTPase-activating protein (RanGAP) involved in mRNA processing and transport
LTDCGITDDYLTDLAHFLDEGCPNLKDLHLARNSIGLEGAMSLASGLVDNSSLRLLNLSFNRLGSKGVMLICESLRSNRTLQSLFVDANQVENDGAYALADLLLEKQTGLLELHIAWNMISHNGLVALFHALSINNRTLKFLDITCNFIEVSIIHSLRQLIERSPTLKYLNISDLHKFNNLAI